MMSRKLLNSLEPVMSSFSKEFNEIPLQNDTHVIGIFDERNDSVANKGLVKIDKRMGTGDKKIDSFVVVNEEKLILV
ncbi:MAG: hypothetical protein WC959_00950 [Kiritimatiellales bacterium]